MHFKNLIRTCLQGEFKCSMLSMNTGYQANSEAHLIEFVINADSCNMC